MRSTQNESLYIRALVWAYEKRHAGFTEREMKKELQVSESEWPWLQWIFFNGLNGAAPIAWYIPNVQASSGQPDYQRFYLTAAGTSAAVDYLELKEAQRSGTIAFWTAISSIGVAVAVGIAGIVVQIYF